MRGRRVSVIIKALSSGAVFSQDSNITDASYSDTLDNKKSINKYGIYKSTYTKEKKVNVKTKFEGVTKEANVSAVGDIRVVAGYSLTIKDKATGLTGKFYITSYNYTFENGTHIMRFDLVWKNVMESPS